MSLNLHLASMNLTAKQSQRKQKPDGYCAFHLFQTPTHTSLECLHKDSAGILRVYTAWVRSRPELAGVCESHLVDLGAFLAQYPDHVWSVW